MFSTLSQVELIILAMFNLSSANAFNLNQSKILSFRKKFKCRPRAACSEYSGCPGSMLVCRCMNPLFTEHYLYVDAISCVFRKRGEE